MNDNNDAYDSTVLAIMALVFVGILLFLGGYTLGQFIVRILGGQ